MNITIGFSDCPIDICSLEKDEVCGTDGTTYKNLCELNKAKCKDNSVGVAYEGECRGKIMLQAKIGNQDFLHPREIGKLLAESSHM